MFKLHEFHRSYLSNYCNHKHFKFVCILFDGSIPLNRDNKLDRHTCCYTQHHRDWLLRAVVGIFPSLPHTDSSRLLQHHNFLQPLCDSRTSFLLIYFFFEDFFLHDTDVFSSLFDSMGKISKNQ